MMWEIRAGTPHELEVKRVTTPTSLKSFFRTRIGQAEKWAAKFSLDTKRSLEVARREIDNLNPSYMTVGDRRRWTADDATTGTTFVYEIERLD